jgi:hypothetical protein
LAEAKAGLAIDIPMRQPTGHRAAFVEISHLMIDRTDGQPSEFAATKVPAIPVDYIDLHAV